ncbi:hypothetical protein FBU30_000417, partial [Linnemannia zychae]
MLNASSSFTRAGRRILTTTTSNFAGCNSSRHFSILVRSRCINSNLNYNKVSTTATATKNPITTASPSSRAWYSITSTLYRPFEGHHNNRTNNPNSSSSTNAAAAVSGSNQDNKEASNKDEKIDKALLTDVDDLMVGYEGLETVDPKDFPELYPHEHEIEGLSLESHPDNERDFEGFTIEGDDIEGNDNNVNIEEGSSQSVLLSDKPRSEEEFSWFVDDSYPETTGTPSEQESGDGSSGFGSDFVPLWQRNAERLPEGGETGAAERGPEYTPDSIPGLVKLLESERAKNIKVIDMRDKCDWTNWMVVAEGLSERHLGNVADEVYSALKKISPKTNPPVMEGRDTSDWIVIDAGSV